MTALIDFLSSKEVFIVVVIAISICVIGTAYFLIEKLYKSKKSTNTKVMDNKIIRISDNQVIVEPVIDQIALQKEKEVVAPAVSIEKEKTVEAIENTKEEAKIEVEEVKPVVEQVQPVVEEKPTVLEVQPIEEVKPSIEETKDEKIAPEQLVIPIEELTQEIEELESVSKPQVIEKQEETEELIYTEIEPNKEEAQEELKRVTEELLRTQEMQRLDNIELTKFEEQQEEDAIISMDELMKKSKQLYASNEVTQYEDEGNEPISLADLENRMNKIEEEVQILEAEEPIVEPVKVEIQKTEEKPTVSLDDFNTISLNEAYKEKRIFKSSPVISPIFGIENQELATNIELENTANYEKLDEEIKKTNEFLKTLKELQKNLD